MSVFFTVNLIFFSFFFPYKKGKNVGPNLAVANEKESSPSQGISKAAGQKFITGPDGAKWVKVFLMLFCLLIYLTVEL